MNNRRKVKYESDFELQDYFTFFDNKRQFSTNFTIKM